MPWKKTIIVLSLIIFLSNATSSAIVDEIIHHNFNAMAGKENLTCNGSTNFDNPVGCVELCLTLPFPVLNDKATVDAGVYLVWLPCYNATQEVEKEERDEHGCLHKFKKTLVQINCSLNILINDTNGRLCDMDETEKIINLSQCFNNLTGFSKKIIEINERMNISFVYNVKETYYSWHCTTAETPQGTVKECKCIGPYTREWKEKYNFESKNNTKLRLEGNKPVSFLARPSIHQEFSEYPTISLFIFSNRELSNITIVEDNGKESKTHNFIFSVPKIETICFNSICLKNLNKTQIENESSISFSYPIMLFRNTTEFRYVYQKHFPIMLSNLTKLHIKICDEFGFCFNYEENIKKAREEEQMFIGKEDKKELIEDTGSVGMILGIIMLLFFLHISRKIK